MRNLRLFVETPCGGDSGHRFLTSCPDTGEWEISRIVDSASIAPIGHDYISVSREASQFLANSTVRTGTEVIVLHGIKTQSLGSSGVAKVQHELNLLYSSLRELTASIEWSSAGTSMVMIRPELQQWMKQIEIKHFSQSIDHSGVLDQPVQAMCSNSGRIGRRVWILALASAIAATALSLKWKWKKNSDSRRHSTSTEDGSQPDALTQLGTEWACNRDEVRVALARIADWDDPSHVDDDEIQALAERVSSIKDASKFYIAPEIESNDGFRETFDVSSVSGSAATRRALYSVWKSFSNFGIDASKVKEWLDSEDGAVSRFVLIVPKIKKEHVSSMLSEVNTPLFDRQDLFVYSLLKDVLTQLIDTGVWEKLVMGTNVGAPDDLRMMLDVFRNSPASYDAIVSERDTAAGRVRDRNGSGDDVHAAYTSCRIFIEDLADLAKALGS